ncbi:MAG: chromate transporter [Lachnospiraceae bacterium]|nr:chromate transporter [Lachnospiraceae bacterium]
MKELFELYLAFLRIGAVNFGGGYAMLPLLEEDLVKKKGWVTTDDLMDYFAIGQCTPGIIALNVSTFIGNKKKGIPGAVASTAGFLTCPVAIILVIAIFMTNFADLPLVQNAFAGIRVCVCVLILEAVMRLWKKSIVDKTAFVIYAVIFLLMAFGSFLPLKPPAAVLVVCAGIAGILLRGHKEAAG